MIPKVIHYCWFGENPLPETVLSVLNHGKNIIPAMKLKSGTKKNYDVNKIIQIDNKGLKLPK